MAIRDSLLAEFGQEMMNTRKTLERVPEDKFGWKPHEKSGSMGWLANHVATIPGWVAECINKSELDISPEGKPYTPPPDPKSRQELLDAFDKCVAQAREALGGASDEHLRQPWTLLATGKALFSLPRIAVLRSMVLNHLIHHRGQLTVYLRLNNAPVPALYGPSADEGGF